jgi:hypothetical protein
MLFAIFLITELLRVQIVALDMQVSTRATTQYYQVSNDHVRL